MLDPHVGQKRRITDHQPGPPSRGEFGGDIPGLPDPPRDSKDLVSPLT